MRRKFGFLGLVSALVLFALTTCAQYKGRVVTLRFITKGDEQEGTAGGYGDFYAAMSRRFSGNVVFSDVKETDTLRDVFTRAAISNGWDPEVDGIGPWTWVRKDDADQSEDVTVSGAEGFEGTWIGSNANDHIYGFSVVVNQNNDKRKYTMNWNKDAKVDRVKDLRFYKDTPFNVFTTGIDEKLGDCISIYPKYDMTYEENLGEFYLLSWRTVLDESGEPKAGAAPAVFLQSFTIDSSTTDSQYVFKSLVDGGLGTQYARLNGPDGNETGFVKYTVDRTNENGQVIQQGLFRTREEYEKAIKVIAPDANGEEGTYAKQLYYAMNSFYNAMPEKPSNFAKATNELGFIYNKEVVGGAYNVNPVNAAGKNRAAVSYPVYRDKDDLPLQSANSVAATDLNESNAHYMYFFNGLISKKKLMDKYGVTELDANQQAEYDELASKFGAEEYYVLEPAAVGVKQDASNMINPLVAEKFLNYYPELVEGGDLSPKGFKFERNEDNTLRIIRPGDSFGTTKEELSVLSGRILVPKYTMPTVNVTVNYTVSAIDPDPTKGGVGIDGDKGGWVTDSGDPAIDNKGFPIGKPMSHVLTVRTGTMLAGVRDKLLGMITDNPAEREDPNKVWWPMDVDPLSYLIESKTSGGAQHSLLNASLQIVDYNLNPDDTSAGEYYIDGTTNGNNMDELSSIYNYSPSSISIVNDEYVHYDYGADNNPGKDQHMVYRTYDFARELLYGWRDYKEHGKRYFFDLKRQGMARDDSDAAGGGGEWEIRGDAPEMVSGFWVDSKASVGKDDLGSDDYARPVKGDLYQIFSDIFIRPFYIDAGYAPIPRKVANVVSSPEGGAYAPAYDGSNANLDAMRRLDIFANFIYVPGSKSQEYPAPAKTTDLATARKKWGLVSSAATYSGVTETERGVSLGESALIDAIDDGSSAAMSNMHDMEVMEIPMTYALVYSLGATDSLGYGKWNAAQLNNLNTALNSGNGRIQYVAKDNGASRVDFWSTLPVERDRTTDWVLGADPDHSGVTDGWGIRYRVAKQLCNLMTKNYNDVYDPDLTYAYDQNFDLVEGATGFRLPTRFEYDYIQRIVTQRQQILPSYKKITLGREGHKKDYYVEKREVPYGGDAGNALDGVYETVSWDDSYETLDDLDNKYDNIKTVDAFIKPNTRYAYDFQSSLSMPGMKLKNYDRYYEDAVDYPAFSFQDYIGYPLREMFDVTSTRFENNSSNITNSFMASAKRSLNVRAGSGVMDFESALYLLEPNPSNDNLLLGLFQDYKKMFPNVDGATRKPTGNYIYNKDDIQDSKFDPIASMFTDADVHFVDRRSMDNVDLGYGSNGIANDALLMSGHIPCYAPFRPYMDYAKNDACSLREYFAQEHNRHMKGNHYIGRPVLGDISNYQYMNFRAVRTVR